VIGDAGLLAWSVLIPLAAALGAFASPRRAAAWLGMGGATATAAAAFAVAYQVLASGGALAHVAGGWQAPLGIELYADPLAALMVWMTAAVGFGVSVYAAGYFGARDGDGGEMFWPLWLMLWAGLNALFLSADVFNLYVTLEVVGLAAVALAALGGGAATLAALRYLLVSVAGSLAYLLGVALLYAEYGLLSLAGLAAAVQASPATGAAVGLMVAGLAMKTALWPLHFWLPPAHAGAPAPVSAILSALVVKASFYLLLRLWMSVFPESELAAQFLAALGAAAVILGSLAALGAARLKLLVAYSTVGQIGYFFLALPLIGTPASSGAGFLGITLFALADGFAKAAMFMAAGNVLRLLGSDRVSDVARASRATPLSLAAFALAGISLIGLPPSGGFVAKWLLLSAAIAAGQWWWAAIIAAGGLLAAGYVFRVVRHAFAQPGQPEPAAPPRLPRLLEAAPLALALVAFLMGIGAEPLFAPLRYGAPP
jgi:formate hydrogenlyase subunit 3/multisubunit Na+/H+ antiporter MnhD subunit